ncbi:hypothetical protein RRF57_012873 [Xylaria bambusicola]|uniref:Uncharacterized protein n=1 Tax=Xylaria bambusicola TaxID=326684 RepID=A0AAN7ZB45_9PEZI
MLNVVVFTDQHSSMFSHSPVLCWMWVIAGRMTCFKSALLGHLSWQSVSSSPVRIFLVAKARDESKNIAVNILAIERVTIGSDLVIKLNILPLRAQSLMIPYQA